MGVAMQDQTIVYLGNRDVIEVRHNEQTGETDRIPVEGKRCTSILLEPGLTLIQAVRDLTHPQGIWAAHSDGTPAWVASTDPALAQFLASHWKCELREPDPEPGQLGYAAAAVGEV